MFEYTTVCTITAAVKCTPVCTGAAMFTGIVVFTGTAVSTGTAMFTGTVVCTGTTVLIYCYVIRASLCTDTAIFSCIAVYTGTDICTCTSVRTLNTYSGVNPVQERLCVNCTDKDGCTLYRNS